MFLIYYVICYSYSPTHILKTRFYFVKIRRHFFFNILCLVILTSEVCVNFCWFSLMLHCFPVCLLTFDFVLIIVIKIAWEVLRGLE